MNQVDVSEITQDSLCGVCAENPSKKDGMCHWCLQEKYDSEEWRWLEQVCPDCGDKGRRRHKRCAEHHAIYRAHRDAEDAAAEARKAAAREKAITITPEQQAKIQAVIDSGRLGRLVPEEEFRPEPDADQPAGQLKYPSLRFPYKALPEGRLKQLTDKACEGGLDPGLVVPAILALASSLPFQDKHEGVRINLFVTLLALVGAGKDLATDRGIDVMGLRDRLDIDWTNYAPSGERAVAQHIGDKPGTKDDPVRRPGPRRRCIVTYELEDTLNKSKGETSSVLQAMQHYYDHNYKVYEDSKNRQSQTVNCRLSWLSGLPVGQEEIDETNYRLAFGEGTGHGIGSRMLFGFAEKRVDARGSRNWEPDPSLYEFGDVTVEMLDGIGPVTSDRRESLAQRLHDARVKGFAPGVEQMYLSWQPKRDLSGRDTFHVLKVAVVAALVNGHARVELEDWRFAVAFMDWQFEIRSVFAPGRAKTVTMGEFKEIIMAEVRKRTKALEEGGKSTKHCKTLTVDGKPRRYIRWKAMSNDGKWYRYGWEVEKAIKSLVNDGHLAWRIDRVLSEDGKGDRDEENTSWVELI